MFIAECLPTDLLRCDLHISLASAEVWVCACTSLFPSFLIPSHFAVHIPIHLREFDYEKFKIQFRCFFRSSHPTSSPRERSVWFQFGGVVIPRQAKETMSKRENQRNLLFSRCLLDARTCVVRNNWKRRLALRLKRRKIFAIPRQTGVTCSVYSLLSRSRAFMEIKMQKLLPFWRHSLAIHHLHHHHLQQNSIKFNTRLRDFTTHANRMFANYLRCRRFRLPQRWQRRRTNNPFPRCRSPLNRRVSALDWILHNTYVAAATATANVRLLRAKNIYVFK